MNDNWTEKHQRFCVKNKLFGCVRELYEYLVRTEGENAAIEVDLKREFNVWIAKRRGKPYNRLTIRRAWEKLIALRLILVHKRYSWSVWSCLLVSLDQLKPRKKYRKRSKPNGFAPSKPTNVDDQVKQQQHIFSHLLEAVGVKFQPKYLKRLLKFTKEELEKAIGHFQIRSQTTHIRNPQGWIVDCLHNSYWLDYEGNLS